MTRRSWLFTSLWLLSLSLPWSARADSAMGLAVDLELVLAVDASGSVDEGEYALQMSGIAGAFRNPLVLTAIAAGPHGRIAVAVMTWAEAAEPKDAGPWTVIGSAAEAETFAAAVERMPRRVAGGTGIGTALVYSAKLIEQNAIESLRQVIDLSGDGRETTPRDFTIVPRYARHYAISRGMTINGLAILNEVPDLDRYYRSDVIGGGEAFAMAVRDYKDFGAAITRKLIREIRYQPRIGDADRPRALQALRTSD